MMSFIPPRLRKPAGAVLAGALFAAAWLVNGALYGRVAAVLAAIAAVLRAIMLYRLGGEDSDEGALAGSRADERQQLVGLQSRSLACNLAVIAAFMGLCAGIAAKATWWWPFAAILAVAGFGYLLGLSSYGSGEPEPEDDADAWLTARSPGQG
ncbi:MAG: hypothetical protein WAK82_13415 [Streptosporangiaceae bacterium]